MKGRNCVVNIKKSFTIICPKQIIWVGGIIHCYQCEKAFIQISCIIREIYGMKTLCGICGLLSTTVPECRRGVVSHESPKLTCFTLFDVNSRILFINELNTQD